MVPGGQGEVQVQVARYYRSWGERADGLPGPTATVKRFGPNDDASDCSGRRGGGEGRGGLI